MGRKQLPFSLRMVSAIRLVYCKRVYNTNHSLRESNLLAMISVLRVSLSPAGAPARQMFELKANYFYKTGWGQKNPQFGLWITGKPGGVIVSGPAVAA
jgi:hypothetical protein